MKQIYRASAKSETITWGPLVELTWNDPTLSDMFLRKNIFFVFFTIMLEIILSEATPKYKMFLEISVPKK